MGDISRNFSYSEFTDSEKAREYKIDNSIPTMLVKKSIAALVTEVLQPLRDKWGNPLSINSGYRCDKLNRLVGGASTSQHRKGEAADVKAGNPYELAKVALSAGLPFDQMILYPTFVHFSHKYVGAQRRQVLYNKTYTGKKL